MWPSAWGYESTPEGAPIYPQGIFQYLTGQQYGPEGFGSSTTVDTVIKHHGASCHGKTVFIVGESSGFSRPQVLVWMARGLVLHVHFGPSGCCW